MDLDPKKLIEMTGEVVDSIGLFKKAKGLFPTIQSQNKPAKARRKADWDPERDGERRISGVELRLRTGIWLQFHRKTGLGKFEPLATTEQNRDNLIHAFVVEGANYQFSERSSGVLLLPSTIASMTADIVCSRWSSRPEKERQAVLLTDEFANHILSSYNVRAVDRRKGKKPQSMVG
jgi:hypothetical protein